MSFFYPANGYVETTRPSSYVEFDLFGSLFPENHVLRHLELAYYSIDTPSYVFVQLLETLT